MNVVVGVGDMRVSNNAGDTIVTYALGSCIGVSIYDMQAKVGGLLHFQLPDSRIKNGHGVGNPKMFADTGIPLLFRHAYALGASKQTLVVKVAGGSQLLDEKGFFAIGKRNFVMLKKIFWQNQVLIAGEHVGGNISRTMYLEIATGRTWLKIHNEVVEL